MYDEGRDAKKKLVVHQVFSMVHMGNIAGYFFQPGAHTQFLLLLYLYLGLTGSLLCYMFLIIIITPYYPTILSTGKDRRDLILCIYVNPSITSSTVFIPTDLVAGCGSNCNEQYIYILFVCLLLPLSFTFSCSLFLDVVRSWVKEKEKRGRKIGVFRLHSPVPHN